MRLFPYPTTLAVDQLFSQPRWTNFMVPMETKSFLMVGGGNRDHHCRYLGQRSVTQIHCPQSQLLLTLVTTNDEQAKQMDIDVELCERSATPRELPQDDDDVVSETSDFSMVIRMAPQSHGEVMLSVELRPSEGPGSENTNEEGNPGGA
ncbi:hypothetical protein COCON_G00213220 [Conger conger]|uniref:Uncharacterized protein n=1 Tax=Conger conger TaxID=82655 RepID=A0A9Q1CXI2_CONCO|nr:hypothetical protein COCON_G00213220 [Conger conger]